MNINEAIKSFPKRAVDAHKGNFGHVLVIAGSGGGTGAAYLTAQAAALSGSGLVTLAVGRSIFPIMAVKLTEVMVRPFFETRDWSLSLFAEKDIINFSDKADVLAIGPGISQNKETQDLVRNLIAKVEKPVVLDADGINACAGHVSMLKTAKSRLILTPHPGEMARLIGQDIKYIEQNRKDVALKFAAEYNTVLVLKGHNTVVAAPTGDIYVNETGNAGMATGGSGDVLTGMIASFIGQGAGPFIAAALGVYFHGLAGDIALKDKGALSLLATDILNKLPEALKALA
ncbi:MAG: NAD(P)H-hydrate dehydratase [Candidatus Omnitrophica bacterium]|nr:NAD(P)H-hydrate dehydratase [Candidatus Omnitrophota bacterium]